MTDLKEKSDKYDAIVKIEMSYNFEPILIIYCNNGEIENVIDFCKNYVPFGVDFEIREVV